MSSIMREDWEKCILDDLLLFMTNGSSAKQFEEKVGLPISRIETIWDEKIDFERVKYIKESEPEFVEKYQVIKNDILLSHINSDSHLGKTAIYKNEKKVLIHGINLLKLRPQPEIIADFLLHQFRFKKIKGDFIAVAQRAVNQSSINQRKLKVFDFVIAPLPEQRAIVAKIEELFLDLDKGVADLKKAQNQLKVYRQAVLKKAFEGEWEKTSVGELFDFVGGGTPSKKEKDFWNGNIPWASVKDIKGDYLFHTLDSISEVGLANSSANLAKKREVLLITRISPGKTIISNIDTAINQDLKIVKPKIELFNKFVHFLFKSIERKIVKLSSGTTVKGINLNNLKSIEIPNIELNEQHQIVQEIESRLSVCDKVEESITESLEKAQALRQSILKKAFEGRLLSQEEITACKAAPDYEPASVLLARIEQSRNEKSKD